MFEILLAAVEGKIQVAAAALGVPIGIGLIGFKACESVGRNRSSTAILVQSIIAWLLLKRLFSSLSSLAKKRTAFLDKKAVF